MKTLERNESKRTTPVRDRHHLYQLAVQSPEHDTAFIDGIFKKRNGRLPRLFREDFCGTAFLSSHWVRVRRDNRAIAVDLDPAVLDWSRSHNVRPLGAEASRVTLVRSDVRRVLRPKVEVIVAFNYSYFVFKERAHLLEYFRAARRCLQDDGIFALDIFGGSDTQAEATDRTRHDGFTLVWEQHAFDPLTNRTRFFIHFEFDKGPPMRRAFSYDWRMWSIPEVRDALAEAGFRRFDVYWEGIDRETGEGNGEYRLVKNVHNHPSWNAIIIAG